MWQSVSEQNGAHMKLLPLALVCVFTVGAVAAVMREPDSSMAAPTKAQTAEEARFDLAFRSAKAVKGALRDPSSVRWDFVGVNDAGTVACIKYHAKNGFGGYGASFAVIENNNASDKQADWNRSCTKALHDQTVAAG